LIFWGFLETKIQILVTYVMIRQQKCPEFGHKNFRRLLHK